jgi:hypothetical protein
MGIFAWLSSEHIHHLDVNWGEVLVALGLVATAVPLTASVRLLPQSDFFNCRQQANALVERRVQFPNRNTGKEVQQKPAKSPYPIRYTGNREQKNKRHPSGGVCHFRR